jgi:hypothetical protein
VSVQDKLIRGIFCKQIDNPADASDNISILNQSGFEFSSPYHEILKTLIINFYRSYHHAPQLVAITDSLTSSGEQEALRVIQSIAEKQEVLTRGDFMSTLSRARKDIMLAKMQNTIEHSNTILNQGITVKENRKDVLLKGPSDAASYFLRESSDILRPINGHRISGEITQDVQEAVRAYDASALVPKDGVCYTGLAPIDEAFKGLSRSELWVHLGFSGHGKSTSMRAWVYNNILAHKGYECIFSLEESLEEVRSKFQAMHSVHPELLDARMHYGIQESPDNPKGLSHSNILNGTLTPDEYIFWKDHVLPSFKDIEGRIHVECPNQRKRPTIEEIWNRAEMINMNMPFNRLIVDHGGIISAPKGSRSEREGIAHNYVELKRMAQGFSQNKGVGVLSLHQINRDGYSKASKANGLYDLNAAAGSAEIVNSANFITAIWSTEEMQKEGMAQFQALKSRSTYKFEPFFCRADWSSGRIYSLNIVNHSDKIALDIGGDSGGKQVNVKDYVKSKVMSAAEISKVF